MSVSGPAVATVLRHEGGWVHDPADPGGETNFGLSWKVIVPREGLTLADLLPGQGVTEYTPGCLQMMKGATAARLYERWFYQGWKVPSAPSGYAGLVDQVVASKTFDLAVNFNPPSVAHELLQRALCGLGVPVAVDGVLGPKTIDACNGCDAHELLVAFAGAAAQHYRELAAVRPTLKKFLPQWLIRSAWPFPP